FPTVLQQVSSRCNTELGKERALDIAPIKSKEELMETLGRTSEYLASFSNDNRIPNHGFDQINPELGLLKIENSTLEIIGFRKIGTICKTVAIHQKFLKKFKEYYPLLFQKGDALEANAEIPDAIDSVIDKFGEIKDSASAELAQIRSQINQVRAKIDQSFGAALGRYQSLDYLDEIRESVVENRRVLAANAMHRKRVKGSVMGASKTGSIVYIVPEATLAHARELNNLEFEEKEEIQKILNRLTDQIRPFRTLLREYQNYLTDIDITAAKAKYASEMNGVLPEINTERKLFLRDAYHPLLYLSNKRKNEKTWPQSIELHKENRIIVISG